MKKTVVLYLITLIIIGCDGTDTRMKIVNKSTFDIYFEILQDTTPLKKLSIKDTLYSFVRKSDDRNVHKSGSSDAWKIFLKRCIDKKMTIFIYNSDTLVKYISDTTYKKQLYVKRYRLTEEELEKMNWTIVFDGK